MASIPTAPPVRCYYEVLGIELDADVSAIKKAHRRQARRLHPDKNIGNAATTATAEFLLVQQAYECLVDPQERQWYNDHRTAILKGWTGGGGGSSSDGDGNTGDYLFDVTPFTMASCYSGYDDTDDRGFYRVYAQVFCQLQQEEYDHYHQSQSTSTANESSSSSFRPLPTDFGTSSSPWPDVSAFYAAWEGFSSCLNFAWADDYDTTQADHRQVRRAMQDENVKLRRAAKKARNDDVAALVRFVKRRDPRVQQRRLQVEQERVKQQRQQAKDAANRKLQAKLAREEWRQSATFEQAAAEQADWMAGRVRLADLDDDYDYGGGKKGKKKKNKGRKKQIVEESDDDEENVDGPTVEGENVVVDSAADDIGNAVVADDDDASGTGTVDVDDGVAGDNAVDADDYSVSDSDSTEPDSWRCDCCRKDFKSEGQLENHFNSKKHKAAFKKWQPAD